MNNLGVNILNIAIAVTDIAVFIVMLVIWFFLNRTSTKANEQIALLTELLEQQKQQTELLARLIQDKSLNRATHLIPGKSIIFKNFIAER